MVGVTRDEHALVPDELLLLATGHNATVSRSACLHDAIISAAWPEHNHKQLTHSLRPLRHITNRTRTERRKSNVIVSRLVPGHTARDGVSICCSLPPSQPARPARCCITSGIALMNLFGCKFSAPAHLRPRLIWHCIHDECAVRVRVNVRFVIAGTLPPCHSADRVNCAQ